MLRKSARITLYVKLNFIPYLCIYMVNLTYKVTNFYLTNFNNNWKLMISYHYLFNFVFKFYKNFLISRRGLLTNNLTKSYNYKLIEITSNYIRKKKFKQLSYNRETRKYLKSISIIYFSLKNTKTKKLFSSILY